MVVLSHATGNANSRQALLALYERNLLAGFYTTVAWDEQSVWNKLLPAKISRELNRRNYRGIPKELIHTAPVREICRLLSKRLGMKSLWESSNAPFSILQINRVIDGLVAEAISSKPPQAVFAYEDGAMQSFLTARRLGIKTIYEVPTAYGRFKYEFFREEAELQPAFSCTFNKMFANDDSLRHKDEELELADQLIVSSSYVRSTFPAKLAVRARVIPYGAPPVLADAAACKPEGKRKLRVLYVGALTQGKGLSYLLEAIKKVESAVEFTMVGSRVGTCTALDAALQRYRWVPSAPHSVVLEMMSQHDVFAFPTLSEGFGLVILEAMSRGMAVITTPNCGGFDIISDGKDGFIIPIRSSEALAAKIELLNGDRELLKAISAAAVERAQECTWQEYRARLASAVEEVLQPVEVPNHA